ncbi:MAG TPA: hypothetical protein VF103_11110, partial [Polyangiaceae bacterium]
MNENFLGSAALKRLLAAACLIFSVVMCGGDDGKGGSGGSSGGHSGASGNGGTSTGGTSRGGSSGSGAVDAGGEGGMDGHAGAGGGTATTLSGYVGGYLEGATVFLDLDEDFVRDSNEPRATTASDGSFELEVGSDIDPASYPVVAIVPDSATDSITGLAVPDAFVLAAPAGENTFVSPLSSLVVGLL